MDTRIGGVRKIERVRRKKQAHLSATSMFARIARAVAKGAAAMRNFPDIVYSTRYRDTEMSGAGPDPDYSTLRQGLSTKEMQEAALTHPRSNSRRFGHRGQISQINKESVRENPGYTRGNNAQFIPYENDARTDPSRDDAETGGGKRRFRRFFGSKRNKVSPTSGKRRRTSSVKRRRSTRKREH
jgi:hypothetical protein